MTMIIWCDLSCWFICPVFNLNFYNDHDNISFNLIMDVYVIRPNTGQMNLHDKSHHIIMVIMDVYVIRPNTGQMNLHDKSHHIIMVIMDVLIIWCDLSCWFICPVFGRIT
jgi:hypothetical protein